MRNILFAAMVALLVPTAALAQSAQKESITTEAQCSAKGFHWQSDRCFTGKPCELKPDGRAGDEAIKDGVRGCSRTRYFAKDEDRKNAESFKDPDVLAEACRHQPGYTWILGLCYTGKTCTRQDGKQGREAIKEGVLGCAEYG